MTNHWGRFLWATLAIPTIFDQITIHDIRDRLRELPRGLNDLFEFLIKKLSEQQKSHADFAEHVLLWLAFAEAPLSAQAICEAYAVRASDHYLNRRRLPQPGLVNGVCLGLVELDKNSGAVQFFSHFPS
jgi:hypothetical protein